MTQLSVNLNKIALIRNSRGRNFPAIEDFAHLALKEGAVGVTIHPRPDQRHARFSDIALLQSVVKQYQNKELNVEGYPSAELIQHVLAVKPSQFTLVPDADNQITSDHGWDLTQCFEQLADVVAQFKDRGTRLSIFVDPDLQQIELAAKLGVERIELYTEAYAVAAATGQAEQELIHYMRCADLANSLGLTVNAGHDLDLNNLAAFVQQGNIAEVSIGHALVVESLQQGFSKTLEQYIGICHK